MYKVDGTKIYLTRGDTFYCTIGMTKNDEPYIPEQGDSIRFVLKHAEMTAGNTAYKDYKPLLEKSIPTDTLLLKLEAEDTKKFKFGKYVYDIEITFANGDVYTFINNSEFNLIPEVD